MFDARPGDYISPTEAAEILGVTAATVRRWIRGRLLPAAKLPGGKVVIYRPDLALLLDPVAAPEAEQ